MTSSGQIVSLQVGRAKTVELEDGKKWRSAISKSAVEGKLFLGDEQLDGDQQANRKYHGGPDKAVCCFSAEHYPDFREYLELSEEAFGYGAFGENFTLEGFIEETICIGDVYTVGSAVVQVSQPRQPCINLVRRWGDSNLPNEMIETSRTGYYLRVLQTGEVAAGDELKLTERPLPDLSIATMNDAMYDREGGFEFARRLAATELLSEEWRGVFIRRIASLKS